MIKHKYLLSFCLLCMIFMLISCASQGRLSGGIKDKSPPGLDTIKSSKNMQTKVFLEEIVLYFDEFINLKNPIKEIVVSPPFRYPLEYVVRGKKLSIKFSEEEVLKKDATYSINFGKAITDFTEGNVLQNFSFVFSTGDYIDSLSIDGVVKDAFTKEPMQDVLVMLYDVINDSIIYKERPFYFTRTDKSGSYNINNIKNDSFLLFALIDQNLNYFLDSDLESMAFLDSMIILTDDNNHTFDLEVFSQNLQLDILSTESRKAGKISMLFNKEIVKVPDYHFSIPLDSDYSYEKDSMWIWYDTTAVSVFDMYINGDTIDIKVNKKKEKSISKMGIDKKRKTLKIAYSDSLLVKCSYPITAIEIEKIVVRDTSDIVVEYDVHLDLHDKRKFYIIGKWKPGNDYQLVLADSILHSYNNIYNDSTIIDFKVLAKENLGIINLKMTELDSSYQYIIQLLDGGKLVKEWNIVDSKQKELTINNLLPLKYSFHFIEDKNKNGRWDTGNYHEKRQAERIVFIKVEKLKENWELEVEMTPEMFK